MGKPTKGRMLNRDISNSHHIAALSPEAAVLFFMIIPHLNSHGKMNGGAGFIKDEICPFIPYLTFGNIPSYLTEISQKTNMKYWCNDRRCWIHAIHFLTDHQTLDPRRLGADALPSWPGLSESDFNPDLNMTTPDLNMTNQGVVSHEVEVEVEDEVEVKKEGEDKKLLLLPSDVRSLYERYSGVTQVNPGQVVVFQDFSKRFSRAIIEESFQAAASANIDTRAFLSWCKTRMERTRDSPLQSSPVKMSKEDRKQLPGYCPKCGCGSRAKDDHLECKGCGFTFKQVGKSKQPMVAGKAI